MSQDIPPPPTSQDFETPAEIPTEVHASPEEILPKRSRFSWANFGGDGFLVSLVFHGVLALVAIFWVISTFIEKPEEDHTMFATGAGGGTGGERAKNFEHRVTPKNARNLVKTPNKITVKGASSSVALPDMPQMGVSAFEAGALMGGSSKGIGGGAGGGEGTGIGVGRGGGRNMVSLFGMSGFGANVGLVGTFYDFKQTADKQPTDMEPNTIEARQKYTDRVRAYARSRFQEGVMSPYFRSDQRLTATQFYFPHSEADDAPKAFEVPDVKASRWMIHYTGYVRAPKTGKFRFVGRGDDILAVYWNDKPVLDAGFDFVSEKNPLASGHGRDTKNGSSYRQTKEDVARRGKASFPFKSGAWIDVVRGQTFKMDVIVGETPGGKFHGYVLLEESENPSSRQPGNKLVLFKIGNTPVPDQIKNGDKSNAPKADMTGGDWVWQPVARQVRR